MPERSTEVRSQELHAQIQYRLMEELSASERRYRELVERIREVVFKCDVKGRISYLNGAWRDILGYPVEASLGRQLADYLYEEDREKAMALITGDYGHGESPEAREVRLRRSDRSLVWLMMTVQTGETEGKVGSLYNIDDRKKAQQALRKINEQLEERVQERTAQLAESNNQLAAEIEERRRAQENLLKAERLAVVGETSGRVAHEVLNPITGILSRVEYNLAQWQQFAQLVENSREIVEDWHKEYSAGTFDKYLNTVNDDGLPYGEEDFPLLDKLLGSQVEFQQKRKEDLGFMHKQLLRVIKIINNLRESVITQRHIRKVDMGVAISEAYDVLGDSLAKRHIRIVKRFPEELPPVMADESEMVQAFTNLFRNAMQSIDEKKERNGIIETEVLVGDELLEIRIRDNGTGIPEEAQRAVFSFDFSTKTKDQGTGLGLGISRRFVRETGGDLVLEQTVYGQGTTFVMTLPYLKEDSTPEA